MYVYANMSGVVLFDGGRVRLTKGDTWEAGDPFVKARPDLFESRPTVVHGHAHIEQATAAPGEKRRIKRD